MMAGAVGFEPTVHEIKTRCLTTWLRPNNIGLHYLKFIFKHFRITDSIKTIVLFFTKPDKISFVKIFQ
jgi:hypothetical protein